VRHLRSLPADLFFFFFLIITGCVMLVIVFNISCALPVPVAARRAFIWALSVFLSNMKSETGIYDFKK
jgi:hypothetical protein